MYSKNWKNCYLFADGSKIIHDVILFSIFLRWKINFVIMTILQVTFELNWLNISREDGGGKYNSSPWNKVKEIKIFKFCR